MSTITDRAVTTAIQQAWSNPQEDKQHSFKPAMLSKPNGAKGTVNLPWDQIYLPDQDHFYVVYQIGQLDPEVYGIEDSFYNWTPINEVCDRNDLILQFHTKELMMYLGSSFVKRTQGRNTLFAIRLDHNRELFNLKEDVFIRFYSNAWLNTPAGIANQGIDIRSTTVDIIADAGAFIVDLNAAIAAPGLVWFHHNGVYKDSLILQDVELGDRLEYYHDHSGSGSFDVALEDMVHFDSVLDDVRKYLVQRPVDTVEKLVPFSDIEVYLCTKDEDGLGNEFTRGVYYSKLYASNVRSLTQSDWSVESLRLQNILVSHDDTVFNQPFIRVFLRDAVETTELVNDGNYIKDLYLLGQQQRKELMVGGSSVIPEWRAENLEASSYMQWLGRPNYELGLQTLKDVYSYHGLNQMMERPIVNGSVATLPPIMENGGLVINYNASGVMVSQTLVPGGGTYALPVGVDRIELVPGYEVDAGRYLETGSSYENDDIGDYAVEPIYRDITGQWHIAEEGTDFNFDLENNVINWTNLRFSDFKAKRLSGSFYRNSFVLKTVDVTTLIPIFPLEAPFSGLELGRLDIWINGHKGIRGFNYSVEYPNFRILDKKHYTADDIQIDILFSGLSEDREVPKVDFIKHRLINYNVDYSLAYNRNFDINIGGMVARYNELNFSERPIGTMRPEYVEGLPYTVEFPINHINNVDLKLLSKSKSEAISKDEDIEAYFTKIVPEAVIPGHIVIPNKYPLVSLLMHTLIEDILSGALTIDYDDPSSDYVALTVTPYLRLLSSDPFTNPDIDFDYVDLHPTARLTQSGVRESSYVFLTKVNESYLGGLCNLNSYLFII